METSISSHFHKRGIRRDFAEKELHLEITILQLRMNILQTVQKQYAIVGISSPSNQLAQKCPFKERIFFGFLLFAYLILSQFVYIFHVASGFMELMVAVCSTSASITMFACFAAVVYRKSILFQCIANEEKLLEASTSRFFYSIFFILIY